MEHEAIDAAREYVMQEVRSFHHGAREVHTLYVFEEGDYPMASGNATGDFERSTVIGRKRFKIPKIIVAIQQPTPPHEHQPLVA
jgi:hypothetical protein